LKEAVVAYLNVLHRHS